MRDCEECGTPYEPTRKTQRFCKATCRARANARPSKAGKTTQLPTPAAGLVDAVRRELVEAGAVDTVDGRTALVLAGRIESPNETGSAAASMTDRLQSCMDRVRAAAAPKQRDGVGDLEEAASAKLRLVSG